MQNNAVMGSLDGEVENVAFDVTRVKRILNRSGAHIVHSDNGTLFLEFDGGVYSVACNGDKDVKPYFIVLDSFEAFNVSDYRMLFDVRDLPHDLAMGKDITGKEFLCRRHGLAGGESGGKSGGMPKDLCFEKIEERMDSEDFSLSEFNEVKNMVRNMRNGHFFEELTSEFSSKIKEIAFELIDFRKDIKKRIEPGIVEIASKDIPEASNQLEGINKTLEQSTMKIMDINDEQMDTANTQAARLQALLEGAGSGAAAEEWEQGASLLAQMQALVPGLSGEARQVMEFVLPGMEAAQGFLAERESAAGARESLSEPLDTIRELCRDVGTEDESIRSLDALGRELEQILERVEQAGRAQVPEGEEPDAAALRKALEEEVAMLRSIAGLSMKMMEPLSFQDLVGQRIQRIVKLVKSMEARIEDLIISFGIKVRKHKEDPTRSYEELNREVELYKSELRGPQTEGEGLEQKDIDDLLANL